MTGIIVLSGPSAGMHGLDEQRSGSLLPIGDRPALQHIVESLVTQGITSIELIVSHTPELVERLLGTGDRWGCRFRYHLAAQPERPYRSLKVIAETLTEPWVLIHAEQFPCVDFIATERPMLHYGDFPTAPELPLSPDQAHTCCWGGTVVMPPGAVDDIIEGATREELDAYFDAMAAAGTATIVKDADWLDLSSPARLLHSQARLLDKNLAGLLISGTERHPGIWVSRNVTIHPSANLVPPLYIGPNSRLNRGVTIGPHTVIGADCIVDANTVIDNALVVKGSYVGQGLEVSHAIVSHNLLVNVRLDASVDISEDFLLGRLDQPNNRSKPGKMLHSLAAIALLVAFFPIAILALVYYLIVARKGLVSLSIVCTPLDDKPLASQTFSLPAIGGDAWSVHRLAGWTTFLRQFLPGLYAVALGRLSLVGLPPRTEQQLTALPEDWRNLYCTGVAGLITEAALTPADDEDEMQLYLADAYYSVRRSRTYDFTLTARYFGRLFVPSQQSATTANSFPTKPRPDETK